MTDDIFKQHQEALARIDRDVVDRVRNVLAHIGYGNHHDMLPYDGLPTFVAWLERRAERAANSDTPPSPA